MAKRKWHYCGDINLEYGGTFYSMEDILAWDNDDVTAVEIVDGHDMGERYGSSEYVFMQEGSVYVPMIKGSISDTCNIGTVEKYLSALKYCGFAMLPDLTIVTGIDTTVAYDTIEWRIIITEALKAYGGIERDSFKYLTSDPELWKAIPEEFRHHCVRMRAGVSLENWVKKHVLRGLA